MATKRNALLWPALDLAGHELPTSIDCERGIWGPDSRWLAATSGLTAPQKQLERELSLDAGDAPSRATLWRVAGDVCYAVCTGPSSVPDQGSLEKQVLEWRRHPALPAALGALLLLPLAAELDASDWWKQRAEVRWSDDNFDLLAVAPLPVSIAAIDEAVERGLQSLIDSISEDSLADLYARLLAGNRAVTLEEDAQPLPAAALAALLLPLPRSLADHVSIAGWRPSSWLSEDRAEPTADQFRQAAAMARSVLERRPAASGRAATDPIKPVQLALWGPTAAGKTALLAKLFLDAGDDHWEVFPTQRSLAFIQDMRTRMRTENQFPNATAFGEVEGIEYLFRHRRNGVTASLQLEDRAGRESEKLHDDTSDGKVSLRQRLGTADGLVLLFDPMSDPAILESHVSHTLELLHVAGDRTGDKDGRPIAVCVSKADVLIERPSDVRRALDRPDEFVRERVPQALVAALDRYCSNYRLFPVSAAGVRLRHGVIEPVVFIDEALQPRLCSGGIPFNLMAPFSWLLDQLTGAAA